MKICYIIGAGETPRLYIKKNNSFIIAADGGFAKLKDEKPDATVGDFDSLGYTPNTENTKVLPVEKDITDMAYAVRLGEEKGFNTFVLYGGTGGRLDHTFANIALITDLAERGKRAYLIGDGFITTAITDAKIGFSAGKKGIISVFSADERAEGVSLKGLKYGLEDYTLTFANPLGVSNAFTGDKAEISVKKGTLIIMWQEENLQDFIDNLS